jgi:multiple sugar transport system ATP-binding protein
MADIALEHVTKRYPDGYEAVRDMSLTIQDGEFVILVGPSGCGKSTALRMVAGLEDITEGELKIGGEVVNEKSPKDRDIAMVFQNYALYPHMTVRENMGFALKLRGLGQDEINGKVEEAARILDLTQHLDRKPSQLSGGQRQRVAMGRAIVRDPKAFLMDEPLSNLDAKLRVQMRTEVSRIQQRLGTTTIYVTHDQVEAMTLGDRVAVMRSGVLQQVGSPMELYNGPVNLFVAGFIGSPAMNFMPATVEGDTIKLPFGDVKLPQDVRERVGRAAGKQLIAGIRPESFEDAGMVGDARDRGTTFRAQIDVLESMGSELYAHFTVTTDEQIQSDQLLELAQDAGGGEVPMEGEEGRIVARLDPASNVRQGEEAELWVDASKLHLFDPEDGRSLTSEDSGPAAIDDGQTATGDGQPEAAEATADAGPAGATGAATPEPQAGEPETRS